MHVCPLWTWNSWTKSILRKYERAETELWNLDNDGPDIHNDGWNHRVGYGRHCRLDRTGLGIDRPRKTGWKMTDVTLSDADGFCLRLGEHVTRRYNSRTIVARVPCGRSRVSVNLPSGFLEHFSPHLFGRSTCIEQMRPIATDGVAWSFCVLWPYWWAVQKRLNRLRCRLGCGVVGPKKPCVRWGSDPHGRGTLAGLSSRVVSASDCGVRGPKFESRHWHLCLSRQLLRYTVLSTGCVPLLQCLGRLSLPPFVVR